MDINKVQKLNKMASELKKHNVVYSKEDAIKHAEGIYGSEHNYSNDRVDPPTTADHETMRKDIRKLTFALRDAMMEINDLKSKVGKLSNELNDVRVNQRPRQVQPVTRVEQPGQQTLSDNKPKQEVKPQPVTPSVPKKNINQPIDRNNIAPSEVSVEKFFYFGQK